MIPAIYIEEAVRDHPRTREICRRFPRAPQIYCQRYGEVFNRRAQSFRLQKSAPALILARKTEPLILPTPEGYGIGGEHNYYFSHMLNCPFDCRYCFLQGMFRSANHVVFVNFEDFFAAIARQADRQGGSYFFSGYDCDSVAFDGVTKFVQAAVTAIKGIDGAWMEFRTKSSRIDSLVAMDPTPRCVIAYSLTPAAVAEELEVGVPAVRARLEAISRLAGCGWPIGLRFDPLIYSDGFRDHYRELFDKAVEAAGQNLHSVTIGPFRLPKSYFKNLRRQYPREALFAGPLEESDGMVSYRTELEQELFDFCREELARRIDPRIVFRHQVSTETVSA